MCKAQHIVSAKSVWVDQTDHSSVSKATVFRDPRTLPRAHGGKPWAVRLGLASVLTEGHGGQRDAIEGDTCGLKDGLFWATCKVRLLSDPRSRPPFSKHLFQGFLGAAQVACCLWLLMAVNWTKTLTVE